MFSKILVPIDLAHIDRLSKSLSVAAELGKTYSAEVCYVSVTSTSPGAIARSPEEYANKLAEFAKQHSSEHGQSVSSKVLASNDPVANLDDLLVQAAGDLSVDLIVMATHLPQHLDALLPSHGGKVATHTQASIFLVRSPD
jgi:universal stress protein F